jgi:hypothetical protein
MLPLTSVEGTRAIPIEATTPKKNPGVRQPGLLYVEAVTFTLVTRRTSICSVVVRPRVEAVGFLGDVVPGATGSIRNADPPAGAKRPLDVAETRRTLFG